MNKSKKQIHFWRRAARYLDHKLMGVLKTFTPDSSFEKLKETSRRRISIRNYLDFEINPSANHGSLGGFDYYRCIFVHLPKTGGVSIVKTLFGNGGGWHTGIKAYQDKFSQKTFDEYFKFTFVRNPFDRFISAYFYLQEGGSNRTEADRKWAQEHIGHFENFSDFVKIWVTEDNIQKYIHFRPQIDFLTDKNGKNCMDFVGRFENLSADYAKIVAQLGAESKSLPHLNPSKKKKSFRNCYLDKETIEIVRKVYARDLAAFGYDFPAEKLSLFHGKIE